MFSRGHSCSRKKANHACINRLKHTYISYLEFENVYKFAIETNRYWVGDNRFGIVQCDKCIYSTEPGMHTFKSTNTSVDHKFDAVRSFLNELHFHVKFTDLTGTVDIVSFVCVQRVLPILELRSLQHL